MSWSAKRKRNGNDELPTDRTAVKIIRKSRTVESPRSQRSPMSPTKQPVTKVSKLVYETKVEPTTAVVKSVSSYMIPLTSDAKHEKGERVRFKDRSQKDANRYGSVEESSPPMQELQFGESLKSVRPELGTAFVQKRLERQREINEIHDILRGLSDENQDSPNAPNTIVSTNGSKSPNETAQPIANTQNTAPIGLPASSTRRSKTAPDLTNRGRSRSNKGTASTTSTQRTDENRSARSKSSQNLKSRRTESNATSNPTPKQKSYDPEKARQFMQEQRERRKTVEVATKKIVSQVERDEIKKRLENLRLNTLAILQNNVKRARRKSVPLAIDSHLADPIVNQAAITEKKQPTAEQKAISENLPSPRAAALTADPSKNAMPSTQILPLKAANQKAKTGPSTESNRKTVNPPNDFKKIGLLRMVDTSATSHQAPADLLDIGMDKENIILQTATTPRHTTKSSTSPTIHHVQIDRHLPDLELKVPEVKLKPRPTVVEKSTQVEPRQPEKPALPFWLQPTPVQLYPYNFIKAVRKKLEAITNPVLTTKEEKLETAKTVALEPTYKCIGTNSLSLPSMARRRLLSRPNLNENSSVNIEEGSGHKLSTASSVFTPFLSSPADSPKQNVFTASQNQAKSSPPPPPPPAPDQFKSQSDITSSMTINLLRSNTVSEVSSIQSEVVKQPICSSTRMSRNKQRTTSQKHDEDTTASSSVFSSPEKKLALPRNSPNKSESHKDINDLNSRSIEKSANTVAGFNNISPLSVDKITNLNLKTASMGSQSEVKSREEFEQMLDDFNKSLSQVIEVNMQLKSTLSRSPRSYPSKTVTENITPIESHHEQERQSKRSSSKSDNYSSDFEEAATNKTFSDGPSNVKRNEPYNEPHVVNSKESSTTTIKTVTNQASTEQPSLNVPPLPRTSVAEETIKNNSNYTDDFHDSIDDASRTYEKLIYSPNNQNMLQDSNNFSKDSLELQKDENQETDKWPKRRPSKIDFIQNQINFTRGDENPAPSRSPEMFINHRSDANVLMSDDSLSRRPTLNSSMGSDIFAIFNQSEVELSIISQSSRLSETHMNYSTLGLYEQLIKTEATKTDHLTALLKIREKSILDRTRGQIALLEIQKEKCKAKGLTVQISVIKRKQRAILMKMEKEREEIKRILKLSEKDSSSQKVVSSGRTPRIPDLPVSTDFSFRKSTISMNLPTTDSKAVIKGFELNSSQNLEGLLQERENELQRRREQVERLLKWHQRLDKEEEEVLKIEEMLFKYNQQKRLQPNYDMKNVKDRKKQKKLMAIDKSLRELQNLSMNSGSETGASSEIHGEYVRASGRKLNQLWSRLTGRPELRYEQKRKYKLNKSDLEKLYEDAKQAVIEDFEQNDAVRFLSAHKSKSNQSSNTFSESNSTKRINEADIPNLNLNFSSGTSESEQMMAKESVDNTTFVAASDTREISPRYSDVSTSQHATDTNSKNADCGYTTNFSSSDSSPASDLGSYISTINTNSCDKRDNVTVIDNSLNGRSQISVMELKSNGLGTYTSPKTESLTEISITYSSTTFVSSKIEDSEQNNVSDNENNFLVSQDKALSPPHIEVLNESLISLPQMSPKLQTIDPYVPNIIPQNDNPQHTFDIDISIDKGDDSETMIEDISQPKFESTVEDLKSIAEDLVSDELDIEERFFISDEQVGTCESYNICRDHEFNEPPTELERRLMDLDESLRELNAFDRALTSPDRGTTSFHTPTDTVVNHLTLAVNDSNTNSNFQPDSGATKMTVKDYLLNPEATSNLMPDIINEVELRRRQQILVESDIIQLENTVPYALLREIPNKPPPPYVPPAHGSPMTTIFPSEARIKEIIFRRTKELYEKINGKEDPSEEQKSILDENITNIYERTILDICKECIRDYQPTFTSNLVVVGNYKMPLALYNPPNRLKCVQEFVYKRVRKLLSMDKQRTRQNSIFSLGRRKRDYVDEILIQELFEEEYKWTNFDLEEAEVRDSVEDEIFNDLVKELIEDFEESYINKRLKERGKDS